MSDNFKKAYANVVTQHYTFCFAVLSGNTVLTSAASSRSASFIPNILFNNLTEGRAAYFHREQHAWSVSQVSPGETSPPSIKLFHQIIATTTLSCIYL